MAEPTPNRKRSKVWNHFSEVANKKAKCSYCPTIMAIPSSNTGNLARHLRKVHPTVPCEAERQSSPVRQVDAETDNSDIRPPQQSRPTTSSLQPSIQNFTVSSKPIPPRRAEKIDEQLVRMIASGHYPFRLVEDEEFVKFVAMLCPQYKLPTRKTLSESLIPKMHTSCMERVKMEVEAAPAVCLATDGWTSINNDSFLAVTAHYLRPTPDATEMKSSLLGCVEYSERHTAINLTAFLREIMSEWNITHKTTAIASDNAANITAAIQQGNWRQIPCFAHSLNLCVQKALAHISPTMVKVKGIVEYFKRSPPAQHKLKELQQQLGLPALKLKQECPTRWNSSYEMLQRLIKTKDAESLLLRYYVVNFHLAPQNGRS